MSKLLNSLGNLLKETEQDSVLQAPEQEAQCAMDLAMQKAIEKHAAGDGSKDSTEDEPNVKVVRRKAGGTFGRRGS